MCLEGGKQHNHVKWFVLLITVYKCNFLEYFRMCEFGGLRMYLFLRLVVTFICPFFHFISTDTLLCPELKSCYLHCVCGDLKCPFPMQ